MPRGTSVHKVRVGHQRATWHTLLIPTFWWGEVRNVMCGSQHNRGTRQCAKEIPVASASENLIGHCRPAALGVRIFFHPWFLSAFS
eukprot:m.343866 g.343866  ORF g.343866 m.343866 type:complete len:86 (-) comp20636_c0_seq1:2234-2491(-)